MTKTAIITGAMGGIGGGPDVAEGADISIVTLPIVRGRIPSVGNKVFTCCTPGSSVAVAVTEAGIALNPNHKNYQMLKEDLDAAGIKTVSIEYLRDLAYSMTGVPKEIETTDKVNRIFIVFVELLKFFVGDFILFYVVCDRVISLYYLNIFIIHSRPKHLRVFLLFYIPKLHR